MSKKVVTVLAIVALVLALVVAGAVGFLWYRNTHVFVEGKAYRMDAQTLDLRGESISQAHFDELQEKLPDCQIVWMVPFQNGSYDSLSSELHLSTLKREEISYLKAYFPALKRVDASECEDYGILEELQAALPGVEVSYQVSLGGKSFAPDTTELALEEGDYDLETLTRNLPHLPRVTAVTFLRTELTIEQVEQLRADFPEVEFGYSVTILGLDYTEGTETIDLSAMESSQLEQTLPRLRMLPKLFAVELCDLDGTVKLTKQETKTIMDALPEAKVHYEFDFFGTKISTDDEEIHIKNVKIGDEGEAEVREALDLLSNCKRFVLENCQISNEVMAKIRDDYRDRTKVVWRVNIGSGATSMSDAQIFRSTYYLVDSNCANLKYLEDVRFLDIGHNDWLKDTSFISGMKSLEYAILSGSSIETLEPFRSCKNLKVLELAFCGYISDISPLADCENLAMLNIADTKVTDLSPLDNLSITHLMARNTYGKSTIPSEEQERFAQQHPDCWASYTGTQPYGDGWRYDENNNYLEWYATIRRVFRYDKDPAIPNNVGWYLNGEDESE